ncbi:MAG TPA: ATP-binding protein [Candidatus Acidoferrum sp.]|nr:ATP-binding protein [Candidatus Acidoferrum sp.]
MVDRQTLEQRLEAANKTIDALMRRVEDRMANGDSAFAVFEQNIALERVVAEKTRQLETQRKALQDALDHLRRAQSELLQAQKLESVGRLASGIAHEINTPIQFVADSVTFVQDAVRDLAPLIESYRQFRRSAASGAVDPQVVAALEQAEEASDLDYLLENVPPALERSVEGLGRVAALVRSMKEFAHPEMERSTADLNHALSTTLTMARNEYKYIAELDTDFGELPPVCCYLGELNQVFLNIIVNAAHAIGAALPAPGQKGRLGVQTRCEAGSVRISISDTGTGIPEEIRGRIFDPFFTTKEVGKGTGQGLSIAHGVVVDKHGGTLTFESELGRGTTFHIRIPREPTAPPAR